MHRFRKALIVVVGIVASLLPRVIGGAPAIPSLAEIREIAEAAYVFAYPLVLVEFTRNDAPANFFNHKKEFPSASFRTVVRPNADTLNSNAWLDLSKEPILLHVPDTQGRFYLVQLMDAWTETVASLGKRTTGTGEGWFAVVGPEWRGKLPEGVKRIDVGTNLVWLLGRVQTNTAADFNNVTALQKGFVLLPLSHYPDLLNAPNPTAPILSADAAPAPARVAQLSAVEFFRQVQRFLSRNPAHTGDGPMMKRLARIGLEAGRPFEPETLGPEGIKALEAGAAAAVNRLKATSVVQIGNNWRGFSNRIGRYGTDYLARAQVARDGLGALPPEDAIYVSCSVDTNGRQFNGRNKYRLHFAAGEFPPVRAFWSLTLYDRDGYFAANSINRYAIGDRDPLERNPDGSLDLWIQHDGPGGNSDRNWLPAPEGEFNLILRMYWPEEKALNGRWIPPAVAQQQP
jgi:hypothetical protein